MKRLKLSIASAIITLCSSTGAPVSAETLLVPPVLDVSDIASNVAAGARTSIDSEMTLPSGRRYHDWQWKNTSRSFVLPHVLERVYGPGDAHYGQLKTRLQMPDVSLLRAINLNSSKSNRILMGPMFSIDQVAIDSGSVATKQKLFLPGNF